MFCLGVKLGVGQCTSVCARGSLKVSLDESVAAFVCVCVCVCVRAES